MRTIEVALIIRSGRLIFWTCPGPENKLWREILGVEHFGSTSVSGLAAKPVLDIMLIIPNTTAAFQEYKNRFGQDRVLS